MQSYLRVLRQFVRESRYAVNERAVAEAIMTRAEVRVTSDRAEVRKHLAWFEQHIKQFRSDEGGSAAAAPGRSVRRSIARRASIRRLTVRSRQHDIKPRLIEFLVRHPGSTVGDLAKGLSLTPRIVSTRLTQLAKAGEIKKASSGYST